MKGLEEKLGYRFQDRGLLEHAMTHSSYANEHRGQGLTSNERLEFLGDSVLGVVVAEHLFTTHPGMPEGEDAGGGRTRPSILADATEAMLAAVYLDGGMAAVRPIIQTLILNKEQEKAVDRDNKTALQELIQRTPGHAVSYRLLEESGPDHCRSFLMEVSVGEKVTGRGSGRTKKEAEQMAAKAALEKLNG